MQYNINSNIKNMFSQTGGRQMNEREELKVAKHHGKSIRYGIKQISYLF